MTPMPVLDVVAYMKAQALPPVKRAKRFVDYGKIGEVDAKAIENLKKVQETRPLKPPGKVK